jgi:hypothetical protein
VSQHQLPVRPDLDQLKHQAKDLLRAAHAGEPNAIATFREHHPVPIDPATAKLADAQLVLARSYGAPNWTRIVLCCRLVAAIWDDDVATVRDIITKHPNLLHENAGIRNNNWGPPMSYAANLGRDRIITMLHELGAKDHMTAIGRAVLQSKIVTARMLHRLIGSPVPPPDALGGAAYTLSVSGTEFILEFGVPVQDGHGRCLAPVDVVLETDARHPVSKHQILELYVKHGLHLPDTPPMALHRGRLDLLEEHLRRDPGLLTRTFTHKEIYPSEVGCKEEVDATTGTPLNGTTLLHMCVEYDELEIAEWLLQRGMTPDARADVDSNGFGGHTALFGTVVSQPNFWMNYGRGGPKIAPFTEMLLDHGADPNVRASMRKQLHPGHGGGSMREYRDVTPLSWGQRFDAKVFVSEPAMRLIAERGGKP